MAHSEANQAVVLGGSIAGLVAARVLADAYDKVVVVDRDTLIGVDGPRKSRPQGRQIHALAVRGRVVMEGLYPGITDELIADECPVGDFAGACRWYFRGRSIKREDMGYITVPATAPLLERHIRDRTNALPNVVFAERCEVLRLDTTPDHRKVTGVQVQRLDGDEEKVTIPADLVVDATGRGSRTPVWLREWGYGKVEENRTKVGLGYATQQYRLHADPWDGDLAIIPVAWPGSPRGAIFTKSDHGRVELTVYGTLGDHPPTDQAGFDAFVESLAVPDIHEALQYATPVDEPVAFRYPTTIRRRYEKMSRFPDGLLVTGEAVTSFNPVYAQGMTVAALSALALRRHLLSGVAPDPLAYFRELAKDVIDPPWEMTETVDLGFPGVEGHRTLKIRMAQIYLRLVQTVATRDAKVTTAYMRTAGMLDRPEALMKPRIALRVLAKSLLGPASQAPKRPIRIPDQTGSMS
jgi:2-polyprenyl-6-methoxyphenol hydroxylase-like FAD-dependent oxidoreductase